ncbi:MAG: hypothetical protein DIU71_01105 [Proteobacteria bacterium]|nr:MAG: hypothetical protein DIU71_01105 [Pseudomonadota bacterium]
MTRQIQVSVPPLDDSLVTYTHVIYGLHALAAFIGLTSGFTVVGSFLFGLPSIVAVIMNYARRSAVRGTLLESHFRWQIRTFWFVALFAFIVWAVSLPLMLVLVGFGTLWIGLAAISVWLVYRLARGWLALRDRRPMYA